MTPRPRRGAARRPHAIATVALLTAMGCHPARPQRGAAPSAPHTADTGRVLPPSVQPGFQRVIDLANGQHRLGAGVRVAGIAIGSTSARLDIDVGGRVVPVTVVDASSVPAHPARWFGLQPDGDLPDAVRASLAATLDAAFPRDPFVGAWAGDHPAESCGSSLTCEEDRVVVDLPHDRGVVPRTTAWAALALLLGAMAATGLAIVREKP